jgi:hypothetical protein
LYYQSRYKIEEISPSKSEVVEKDSEVKEAPKIEQQYSPQKEKNIFTVEMQTEQEEESQYPESSPEQPPGDRRGAMDKACRQELPDASP